MQAFLILFAISQLGQTLSMEASCSVQDIQICKTCKNVQCEVDKKLALLQMFPLLMNARIGVEDGMTTRVTVNI